MKTIKKRDKDIAFWSCLIISHLFFIDADSIFNFIMASVWLTFAIIIMIRK